MPKLDRYYISKTVFRKDTGDMYTVLIEGPMEYGDAIVRKSALNAAGCDDRLYQILEMQEAPDARQ